MDTVQIRITGQDKFQVAHWAQFVQEFSRRNFADLSRAERLRSRDKKVRYLRHFILHPETTHGLTVPKVEIYESADSNIGVVNYEMKIAVSLPKLLFENSLCEIMPSDQQRVVDTMTERLSGVGIQILPSTIAAAPVSVVHFCKNIILLNSISFRRLLVELSRTDIGKAYDNTGDTRTKNKNSGQVLHFYSGSREWCFYEKIEDTKRPKNKSEDKHKTEYEKDLIELCGLKDTEVFRYEYRLKTAQTIKSELNVALGRPYQTPVSLTDLFSEGLWKSVLLRSWKRITDRPENQLALLSTHSTLDLLLHILKNAWKKDKSAHSQNQALWSYGLATAIRDHSAKTVRKELGKIWSSRSDERLDEKMAVAAELAQGIPFSDGIAHIGRELERFEFIHLPSPEEGV